MGLSDLLSMGSNALMKLTESPIATPLALGGVALLIKNFAPRLASGLAGQAVQEVFRPREEKQAANQLLLTHPDLTSAPAPPGSDIPFVEMGGQKIRRYGTQAEEHPGLYPRSGTSEVQAGPAAYQSLMAAVPRMSTQPPQIPASSLQSTPAQRQYTDLFGGLPAGPAGDAAITKYKVDLLLKQQDRERQAASNSALLNMYQGSSGTPGTFGLKMTTGKDGGINYGIQTLTPRADSNNLQPVTVGDQIKYRDPKTGKLDPTLGGPRTKAGTGAAKSTRFPAAGGGPMMVKDDPGELPTGYTKKKSGDGWLITPPPKPSQGLGLLDTMDYRLEMGDVMKEIGTVNAALTDARKNFASPERLAPLEKQLQDLLIKKEAIQQAGRETLAPAGQSQEKNPALQDFFKRNLPATR